MSIKIGIVGYQASGKSTLFEWLTGISHDPSLSHTAQTAMATVTDERIRGLCEIYHPKKITQAALELVDSPGLSRTHEGNAARLSLIREAGCMVQVIAAFDSTHQPQADLHSFEEDFLLTDLEIVTGRVQRLRESIKKPRPNRDEQIAELHAIEPILEHLESGRPLQQLDLPDDQQKAIKSFCLLTDKPRFAIFNVADEETDPDSCAALSTDNCPVVAVPVGLERELARMEPDERAEFRAEMGGAGYDRDHLIRTIMDISRQMLFFTVGDKEVRSWMIPKGTTAVTAAGGIHTDMARGFIRAETMTCDDLFRLGSEREVKAAHLMRQEPKDYIIQDGDVINMKFNV